MLRALPLAALVLCALPAAAAAQGQWRATRLPDDTPVGGATLESEAAILETTFETVTAHLAPTERAGLREVTRAELARQRTRHPDGLPSLLARSHAMAQGPGGFDAFVVEPEGDTDLAAVFLHGYGGNALLPCAVVAEAAERAGAMTVCPSLGPTGHWQSAAGARVLAATLDWLTRVRGIRRVVLVGLSNGAIGASRLLPRFERRLAGVVLISGAAHGTRTSLPALLIHGDADTMTSPRAARAFARRSPNATLRIVPGNHFVLLHRRETLVTEMSDWMRDVLHDEP
ncbi:MAG: hypothetical protein R3B82_14920 [Sandaracinaceae bacterium]